MCLLNAQDPGFAAGVVAPTTAHNRERDIFHEGEVGNRGEGRAGSEEVSRTSGPPSLGVLGRCGVLTS